MSDESDAKSKGGYDDAADGNELVSRRGVAVTSVGPIDAVLFDFDGVLIDSFDAWHEVLADARRRRSMQPLTPAEIRACWGQGILADCVNWFPGADPAELAREYDTGFRRYLGLVHADPEAAPVLERLEKRGYRLALVTNSPSGMVQELLARLSLDRFFNALACGDEVPRGKPDPALVRLALERVQCAPERALMVGDTQFDIEAARAAGVRAVGLRTPGDLTVDSLQRVIELILAA